MAAGRPRAALEAPWLGSQAWMWEIPSRRQGRYVSMRMLRRGSGLLKKAGESPGLWGDSRLAWAQPWAGLICSAPGGGEVPRPFFTSPTSPCFCRWTQQNSVFTHQVITFSSAPAVKIEINRQIKALKPLLKRFLRVKCHMLRLAITCHKASPWPCLLPLKPGWWSQPQGSTICSASSHHTCAFWPTRWRWLLSSGAIFDCPAPAFPLRDVPAVRRI